MGIQRVREPWIQTGIHLPELAPRQFHLCVARLTKRSLGDEIQRMNSPIPRRLALLATLLFSATLHAANDFPPPDNSGGWRTATNAAQVRELAAMDLPRLEQAWEFTQHGTQNAVRLVLD